MLEAVRVRPARRPGLAVWTPARAPRSDAVRRRCCLRCCLSGAASWSRTSGARWMFGSRPSQISALLVVLAGDCQAALLYFRAVWCAELAARASAVQLGSCWTDVPGRSSLDDADRSCHATAGCPPGDAYSLGPSRARRYPLGVRMSKRR